MRTFTPTDLIGSRFGTWLAPATLAVLFSAAAAAAQSQSPGLWAEGRGWRLGAQICSSVLDPEKAEEGADPDQLFLDDVGYGLTIVGGYAFTPQFDLEASLGAAHHGTNQPGIDALHSTAAFSARYRFLPAARSHPYLSGGLGGTTISVSGDVYEVEIRGTVAVMSGGVIHHLTRHLALDLGARLDLVNWDEISVKLALPENLTVELADPVEGSSHLVRFFAGLGWQF